jgi:hypothetical protein
LGEGPTPTPHIFISANAKNPAEVKLETIMQTRLPIQTTDVDIAYSRLIKKFYVRKKTSRADQIVLDFMKHNDLGNIISEGKIVYTTGPALAAMFADEKRLFPDSPDARELDY